MDSCVYSTRCTTGQQVQKNEKERTKERDKEIKKERERHTTGGVSEHLITYLTYILLSGQTSKHTGKQTHHRFFALVAQSYIS